MLAVRFTKGERVDYRIPGGGWRPGVVTDHVAWGQAAVTVAPLTGDRSRVLHIDVTDGTLRAPRVVAASPWRYDARDHVHPKLRGLVPVFIEGPPTSEWADDEDDDDDDGLIFAA